eukprot:5083419-Pleurochrysis_carterae.AAC.2
MSSFESTALSPVVCATAVSTGGAGRSSGCAAGNVSDAPVGVVSWTAALELHAPPLRSCGPPTMRAARAFTMRILRSGGYAACEAERQPCVSCVPPACAACVRCVHEREASRPSAGCKPGEHMNVVYFCAAAPHVHCGNVIRAHESRARKLAMVGISQSGPCCAWRKRGEDTCPLSAGCSRRCSAPASRAARSSDAVRATSMFDCWSPR